MQFNADDFMWICRAYTGRDLKYVTFSLPDADTGPLTYQYLSIQNTGTPVCANTAYYASGSPNVGDVYLFGRRV
ncbi:MAG: hypothetical protein V8R55_08890 [Dysosmobacter sp.]